MSQSIITRDEFIYVDKKEWCNGKNVFEQRAEFWDWCHNERDPNEELTDKEVVAKFGVQLKTARKWLGLLDGTSPICARIEFIKWFRDETNVARRYTLEEMAEKFDVSVRKIERWLRSDHVDPKTFRIFGEFRRWLKSLEGEVERPTRKEICRKFGVGYKILNRWFLEATGKQLHEWQDCYGVRKELKKNRVMTRELFLSDSKKGTKEQRAERRAKRALFWDWFQREYDPTKRLPTKMLVKRIGVSASNIRKWLRILGGTSTCESPQKRAFKEWIVKNRTEAENTSTDELAEKFGVSRTSIRAWQTELKIKKHSSPLDLKRRERAQKAIEYLDQRPAYVSQRDLWRATIHDSRFDRRCAKNLLAYIKKLRPELIPLVKKYKRSRGTADAIKSFVSYFQQFYGRQPSFQSLYWWFHTGLYGARDKEVLKSREYKELVAYAEPRVKKMIERGELREEFFCQEDDSAILTQQTYVEEEIELMLTRGEKIRPQSWLDWIEKNDFLGFDFTGEYWDRYYALFQARTRRDDSEMRSLEEREPKDNIFFPWRS